MCKPMILSCTMRLPAAFIETCVSLVAQRLAHGTPIRAGENWSRTVAGSEYPAPRGLPRTAEAACGVWNQDMALMA